MAFKISYKNLYKKVYDILVGDNISIGYEC